jgi:hypothetical protein
MAQADKTSDAQTKTAIARAVGIVTAQFRQELDLQEEKQRRVVSELQTAVAQLQAQIAAMNVKTERTAGTQMPPPAPPAPPPPPPPPRSTVETTGAMMRRHAAATTAGKGESKCGSETETAPLLPTGAWAWDDLTTTSESEDDDAASEAASASDTDDDGW